MITTATRCPFDAGINRREKFGVQMWSKLIVTIDDRILHPDEYCAVKGSRTPSNPMQGYVIYLSSPVAFKSLNNQRKEYRNTKQVHGEVVIHNAAEAGITHCGGCMTQLQGSDWWDRSTYIASFMQNGKSMVTARQYTRDEMNAHDMEREKVGAAYLAGR